MRMLRSICNRGAEAGNVPFIPRLFRDVFTGIDVKQKKSFPVGELHTLLYKTPQTKQLLRTQAIARIIYSASTGTWLKISYTYNILDVDAVSTQVGDIPILAFDKNDKFVGRMDVDSVTLRKSDYKVKIPFTKGQYNFVIWGGTSTQNDQHSTLVVGETERESILLSMVCDNMDKNKHNSKLKPLFHSSLKDVTIGKDYQVLTALLIKNTNYISCILQDETKAPIAKRISRSLCNLPME